ncbi:hypothetical protein BD770DRAFT_375971 [Pilaira anomala]|nr:hypothetical protein BD770DRAFT_375971 [Pilaira anomala]
MKHIYSETILITDLFDDKTAGSFSTWCGKAKLAFTFAEQLRVIQSNTVSKTKI